LMHFNKHARKPRKFVGAVGRVNTAAANDLICPITELDFGQF